MRRDVTIYIGPDGSRQVFEDNPTTVLIDALVIDDRGKRQRTARLVARDIETFVTGLDSLVDELQHGQRNGWKLRAAASLKRYQALALGAWRKAPPHPPGWRHQSSR